MFEPDASSPSRRYPVLSLTTRNVSRLFSGVFVGVMMVHGISASRHEQNGHRASRA